MDVWPLVIADVRDKKRKLMIQLLTIGIASALGIGSVIALFTWLAGHKRISCISGCLLVFVLSLAYHALAGFCQTSLYFLTITIIVPWGYGFGEGDGAFAIALLIQALVAGVFGIIVYWLITRKNNREPSDAPAS